MPKTNLVIVGIAMLAMTLSCKWINPSKTADGSNAPKIDFTTSAKGLDVKVQLDKKQTASGKIGRSGGSVSLTAADGSRFTLDVPPNAVNADTTIALTAVSNVEGAPLSTKTPTAVQLEPSGLAFKEMATLTIIPHAEIPAKNQIVFGYEADGKDYHLAVVDPKSKAVKIKLMHFSGAGVGGGSDADWAAHLQIQTNSARARISQELGEILQPERLKMLLGGEDSVDAAELGARFKSLLVQFEDQVVLKEIAAAELDCKNAQKALDDLLYLGRLSQLLAFPLPSGFEGKAIHLGEIGKKCSQSYRVNGSSGGASFKGDLCSLDKPFTLTVNSQTGSWPLNFTPSSESGGTMEGNFSAGSCTITGGGPYTVSIGSDGSGTIEWTYTSTSACPAGSITNSKPAKLPLVPAMDVSCP